ncbi:DUF2637 domain-containing protein [Mycobacterium sp. 20091114027_K0903767]|nr:DUF2637 domain-containing protein [Mycobacterium sp. 20091114027_K0903767]
MNIADIDREARKVLWATLVFATVCSLAANITHSIRLHHGGWAAVGPVLLAMLAPVALLILFHLLGVWARRAGYRSLTYWVFLLAILGLGAAAFRLSFAAIRDLAMTWGYGYVDAALFPLILDGLIAVCTVGLVAVQRPRKVEHDAAGALRRAEPVRAPMPAELQVEQPAVVEQQPRSTSVEQPAPSTPQLLREPVEQLVAHPLTWDDADTEPITTQRVERRAEQVTVTPPVSVEQQVERPAEQQVEQPAPAAPQPLRQQLEQPVIEDMERPAEHRATAERLVERGRFSQPVELLERALTLRSAGQSQRQIADELGIGATTVGRIHKAADEIAALVPTA